jgi:hypothetical protein
MFAIFTLLILAGNESECSLFRAFLHDELWARHEHGRDEKSIPPEKSNVLLTCSYGKKANDFVVVADAVVSVVLVKFIRIK